MLDLVESHYQTCITMLEELHGRSDPKCLNAINNLASYYSNQNQVHAAEALYVEALELATKHLGIEHNSTVTASYSLALLYSGSGVYDQSETLFKQCLEVQQKQLGHDHANTLLTLSSFAAMCAIFVHLHARPALIFCNILGERYTKKGDLEKAEPMCVRPVHLLQRCGVTRFACIASACRRASVCWDLTIPQPC